MDNMDTVDLYDRKELWISPVSNPLRSSELNQALNRVKIMYYSTVVGLPQKHSLSPKSIQCITMGDKGGRTCNRTTNFVPQLDNPSVMQPTVFPSEGNVCCKINSVSRSQL